MSHWIISLRQISFPHHRPLAVWFAAVWLLILLSPMEGQIPASELRFIRIGSLQTHFNAYGSKRAWNNVYYEGLRWPADYRLTDNDVSQWFYMAVRNFTDQDDSLWTYKATRLTVSDDHIRFVPIQLTQTAKFETPKVYVDGLNVKLLRSDEIDELDPNQKPDRIITNVVRTSLGLTMTRKIMAFSQQYHDNYFIYEYTYKNTGNIDAGDDIELPGRTLTDLYIGAYTHYATCREASHVMGVPSHLSWGGAQWITKRGETYPAWVAGDTQADSIRCFISWQGRAGEAPVDNIGAPDYKRDGRLSSPQHAGIAFLHVDTDPHDQTDDPYQPATVGWNDNDFKPSIGYGFDVIENRKTWEVLAGDMISGRTDRMDSRDYKPIGTVYPRDITDSGGAAAVVGYGPFTLEFGDSIRIVEVEAVNGLNREMCQEIGARWLEGSGPFTLPGGSETNDRDLYKNSWVYTGKDSLLLTFGRARRNFLLDYDIPQPPPPPKIFTVESGGDRIRLSWTPGDGTEEAPNFGGYRIFRAVGRQDTSYEEIFACGVSTNHPEVVNTYDDITPVRGFPYYYYIVSSTDGSLNHSTANPGGQLHSNRFYTQTTEPAYLRRLAGETLEDIRVVPNPFHIGARSLQYPGDEGLDRIMFLNIPAFCTIKIFTERGDLVTVIRHTDGSGDEAWNSITDSRQVVVSGVYIAHFEVTEDYDDPVTGERLYSKGQSKIRKFAIIR